MKISLFPKFCGELIRDIWNSIDFVTILIVIAIIGLLAAIAIPNFVKAQEQVEKNKIIEQQKAQQSFKVCDTVTVKGLDRKGTVNYIDLGGCVDVLITANNGEPTILKGINPQLINK